MNSRNIPFALCQSIYDLDLDRLYAFGVRVILSDLDNTLLPYGATEPDERTIALKKAFDEKGIRLIICSNGFGKRVQHFASVLGAEAAGFMRKPFAGPLKNLIKERGFDPNEVILVGDQIQTDVRAGNGAGIRTILTEPVDPSYEPIWTKFNRMFDRRKRAKIIRKHLAKDLKEVIP
ncbi:MAG: HAD hydrolase-like protein [Candidatus Enteromonas sp.]|nr:HAD hydrolase-like protein [Candidatus Enteromonas sp.]